MAGIPLSKQVARTEVTAQRSPGWVGKKDTEAAGLACRYSRPQATLLAYWSLMQTVPDSGQSPLASMSKLRHREVKEYAQGQQYMD